MEIRFGSWTVQQGGPGVVVELSGDEVARAIEAYLVSHGISVSGASMVKVNGDLCKEGTVSVNHSGFVIRDGLKFSGDGKISPV